MAFYNYPFPSNTWSYQGVDFASMPNMTAALAEQMYNDGIRFVGRYLYSTQYPNGKGISQAEAQMYLDAGIAIFLYYEVNTSDALGGYSRGVTNGQTAYGLAIALGVPQGTPIICCCDTSVTDAEASGVVMDYLDGFKSQLSDYNVGIYGGANVMEASYNHNSADYRVQAGAWGSQEFSPINIRQWLISKNGSAQLDGYINISNIYIDQYGYAYYRNNPVDLLSAPSLANMWGAGPAPQPKHKMPIWFYLRKI